MEGHRTADQRSQRGRQRFELHRKNRKCHCAPRRQTMAWSVVSTVYLHGHAYPRTWGTWLIGAIS